MEKKNLIILHGIYSQPKKYIKLIASLEDIYNIFYFEYSYKKSLDSQIQKLLDFIEEKNIKEADFITFSFGSIIFRVFCSKKNCLIGKVVQVAPLNQGSKILEKVFQWPILGKLILGQCGEDFYKNKEKILSIQLPENIGVMAGDKRFSFFAPETFIVPLIINNKDSDGKIFIEETKLPKMADFCLVHYAHDQIKIQDENVLKINNFLRTGHFNQFCIN